MRWRGTHATTEGCGAPKRSIICMSWGSRSKSTDYKSWWSSRSSNGLCWSCTVGKGPYRGIIKIQEIRKVRLSETHASGNREASAHNDWWKANWRNKYQQERSRRTWNGEVWEFSRGSEPRRRIEQFFSVNMVREWWMLIFPDSFFTVSYTWSSDCSVYDGRSTYTAPVARTFFCAHPHIFMRVHIHAWLKCLKRFIACVSHLSISPSPFSCLIHPCCSLTVTSRPLPTTTSQTIPSTRSCRTVRVLKGAGHAPLRTCIAKFGYLTKSDANTGYDPKKFDKNTSVNDDTTLINDPDQNTSDFSKTMNENTSQFGVHTVFESSVLHVSHWWCSQSENRCYTEKKEKVLWSVLQSRCHRKVNGTVLVWVWRVTENPVLKSLRKILFWWTRSPRTPWTKSSTSCYCRENYIWMSTRWRSRIWGKESQKTHWLSHSVSLNLKDLLEINGQIKLNVREFICVAE